MPDSQLRNDVMPAFALFVESGRIDEALDHVLIQSERKWEQQWTRQIERAEQRWTRHIELAQQDATKFQEKHSKLRKKHNDLRSQNDDLRSQNDDLRSQNDDLRSQNDNLRSQNDNLLKQNVDLRVENAELRIKKDGLDVRAMELRREAERCRKDSAEKGLQLQEAWKTIHASVLREGLVGRSSSHHKGSTTRTMLWKRIVDENMVVTQPPYTAILPIIDEHKECISKLEKRRFASEPDMYVPVVECLSPVFSECREVGRLGPVTVTNTHATKFLGSFAPDIGICRGSASALTLCAFIEMKLAARFSDADYGQVVDYLYEMRRYQPGRKYYVGMLSTIRDNAIVVLTYTTNHQRSRSSPDRFYRDFVPRFQHFANLSFSAALSKLILLVESAEHNPPKQPFSDHVGGLLEVLGAPRRAALGIFPSPPAHKAVKQTVPRGELMAVKVALRPEDQGYDTEARILKSFATSDAMPFSVPLLVHDSPEHGEIGVMPVGQPFRMRRLHTQEDTRLCLKDVLSALSWIHSRGIVHRDVRPDNVILVPTHPLPAGGTAYPAPFSDRPRAVLIDFDRATELGKETWFQGGYVCCPPRLLDSIAEALDAQPPALESLTIADNVTLPTASSGDTRLWEEEEKYSLGSQTYQPQKSDDFLSFVLMVLTLLVPHCFETFDYSKVEMAKNEEFKRLRALWKELRSSGVWGPVVKAAQREDVSELEKFLEVFVLL